MSLWSLWCVGGSICQTAPPSRLIALQSLWTQTMVAPLLSHAVVSYKTGINQWKFVLSSWYMPNPLGLVCVLFHGRRSCSFIAVPHLDTMQLSHQRLDFSCCLILAPTVDKGTVRLQHKVGGLWRWASFRVNSKVRLRGQSNVQHGTHIELHERGPPPLLTGNSSKNSCEEGVTSTS